MTTCSIYLDSKKTLKVTFLYSLTFLTLKQGYSLILFSFFISLIFGTSISIFIFHRSKEQRQCKNNYPNVLFLI